MEITYKFNVIPAVEEIIKLYNAAGLARPTHDLERMLKMYHNSNLVYTAWDAERLVGACRSITDWVWSCYLADLAVDAEYKKRGIGKSLIAHTKEKLGEQSMILLLSVPDAIGYYPSIGFSKEDRGFILHRKQ